ncbi:MAG: DUF4418 family protein [Ruminococcus sp.]|nr:DUF4418 family protein [Ruminococcus sp.]
MKKINLFLGIAELLVAAALTLGSLFVFNACPGEDGKYMACHWAQNAVVLIGSVLVLALLIRVFIPSRDIKTGITLTSFLLSIAAALIPGVFINLCMMDTMRCHSSFKPGVIAVSAVLAVLTGIDSAVGIVKGRKG